MSSSSQNSTWKPLIALIEEIESAISVNDLSRGGLIFWPYCRQRIIARCEKFQSW